MYAVVRTGGKQYRVGLGDNLEVEKLAGNVGESIVLDDVLLVARDEGIQIGQPNVEGASVTARITGQHRGEKILVFRYRPKKRIRVRRGHRQYLTRLQILKISGEGYEYVKEEKAAAPEPVAVVAEPVVEEVEAEAAVAVVAETDSVVEVDEAGTEEVADTGDSAIDAVKETVAIAGDAVEDVSDTVGDALEAVSDKASDAAEAVGDMAGDAVEAVSDVAGDAVEAVSDAASDAVEAVGDTASDAVDAVAKNLKGLMGRGEKTGDDADADDAGEDKKEEE
jgi:large subunit ribosomal protein L21